MRHLIQKSAVIVLAIGCIAGSLTAATILTRDQSFDAVVPEQAYDGVGAWTTDVYYVATGHASAESLGETKGKRTAREFAENEAKTLIVGQAAIAIEPNFDADSFDVDADISGFRTVATYQVKGKEGIFLVGLAPKTDVHVRIVFSPKKARQKAFRLFEAKEYKAAASQFAFLTQRGIQDPETGSYARAASWHVNLLAGIRGVARAEALLGLGDFYLERKDYEASLNNFYAAYMDSERPDRLLLEKLADLSQKTNRESAAKGFRKELDERYRPEKK